MKRVRLTHRNRKAETQADGLFPGDVGNMERLKNYHKIDEYHKFEQTVNHELPDMRHEWKDDKRDENNIPVPKVASLYAAAQNAIKLSMMLLGDKAPQKTIQAQARDFMKLGNSKLVASMNRWFETEEKEEECEDCQVESCDKMSEETETVEEQPVVEETETVEEQPVAPVAEEEQVVEPEEEAEMTEETEEEQVVESEEEEMEIAEETTDLNTEVDFENISEENDVEADEELQAIFEDTEDDENEVMTSKVASKKKGIKKIAGQPKLVKVASKKADELEGLWSKLDVPGIN